MDVKIKDIDFFVGELIDIGNSTGIIIPARNLKFSGIKKGDTIKVYYKKVR